MISVVCNLEGGNLWWTPPRNIRMTKEEGKGKSALVVPLLDIDDESHHHHLLRLWKSKKISRLENDIAVIYIEKQTRVKLASTRSNKSQLNKACNARTVIQSTRSAISAKWNIAWPFCLLGFVCSTFSVIVGEVDKKRPLL
jgi:hypothetical protein